MENTSDEGGSVDCGPSTPSTDLKEELITNLTSLLQLYRQHQDQLQQKTSEHFTETAALLDMPEIMFLSGLFGGAYGLVCGGVTGGVGGAVGAAGAATYSLFCGDLTVFSATVGCVGSVVGGVVGGAIGGAVSAAAIGTGSPGYRVVCDLFSPALGCAIGGTIGGCFDWSVGAAGGAAGAVLGVMAASCGAASLARKVRSLVRDLEEQTIKKKSTHDGDLSDGAAENKTICDQMVSSAGVQSVSEQTVKRPALRDEADEPQRRN